MTSPRAHTGTVLARVGTHHLAFFRGYLEGLDLTLLAKRYLETAGAAQSELQVAKDALRWIRGQLMQAARRQGHFTDARLILIEPEKLNAPSSRVIPSLDEFREEHDPHEMYSEAELLALFHEEYGDIKAGDRRTLRNERLRRRQLAALSELEKLLDAKPALSDKVEGWLNQNVAQRLQASGLQTLGDLVTRINTRGYRWWTQVPRLGEKTAVQLVAWLRTEPVSQALGVRLRVQASSKTRQLSRDVLQADRPKEFGIVPLEYLALPPEFDGTRGSNRGAACTLAARRDDEVVRAWLNLKSPESSTWRSYRKEAERFLLWAVMEQRRPLSSVVPEDCKAYRIFLTQLGVVDEENWSFRIPADRWLGPRGTDRWSPAWRPFEGPLSSSSRNLAITIIASMYRWLTANGYLQTNPWEGLSGKI